MTLADLIARVERADAPDRELDRDIAEEIGWVMAFDERPNDGGSLVLPREATLRFLASQERKGRIIAPAYTASLDAALSLVPEGWGREFWHEPGDKAIAHTWPPTRRAPRDTCSGFAATPALALCAAALKAREARDAG